MTSTCAQEDSGMAEASMASQTIAKHGAAAELFLHKHRSVLRHLVPDKLIINELAPTVSTSFVADHH